MWRAAAMQLMRSPTAVAPSAAVVRALSSRRAASPAGRAAASAFPRWAAPGGQLHGFAAGSWPEQGPQSQAAAPGAWPEQQATLMEVDWESNRANSVSMIGNMGRDPEVKTLASGKMVASLTLACKRGKNVEGTDWYDVEVWDDWARLAGEQLRRGHQIQVEGRLKQDEWNDKTTGAKRTKAKIVASRLSMIKGSGPGQQTGYQHQTGYQQAPGDWEGQESQPPPPGGYWEGEDQTQGHFDQQYASPQQPQQWAPKGGGGGADKEALWRVYVDEPNSFWDNRETKTNPKQPDFKRKSDGEALWLNGAPAWVKEHMSPNF